MAHRAWRILQCPKSLSAKVLKEKYFTQGDFLTESFASRRSQVWRAMLDVRDTLKQGLIRWIISGEGIDPWKDNWLLCNGSLRTIACL